MGVPHPLTNRQVRGTLVYYVTLALVAAMAFAIKSWFFLTGDIRNVVNSVPDDTAYFYKVALNVVQGKGLTFDGVNLTNGFQPLWLYLLLPLAWLMQEATPEAYFRAALIYQNFMVFLSGLIFFHALTRVTSLPIALMSTAVFYLFGFLYFSNGMETGILMLCLSLLLAYSLRHRVFWEPNPRTAFGFGLLAGLLLLARLDMVFLLGVCYVAATVRAVAFWRSSPSAVDLVKSIPISILAVVVVTAPYFLYNQLVFGAFMPISGQLKNSFPHIIYPEFGRGRFRLPSLIAVGISAGFCLWFLLAKRHRHAYSRRPEYLHVISLICALTTLAHYLNTALFMKWAVFGWHFAPYYFTVCLIFASVLNSLQDWFLARSQLVVQAGAVAWALLTTFYVIVKSDELYNASGWHSVSYEAAVWARQNTPPNTVFAMKDAGIFGLFSQRAVINLDGLVNNMDYQKALHRKQLNQYLRDKGVQYLVQHAMRDEAERNRAALSGNYEYIEMRYRSQLYGNWSDPVRLYRTDEVYRSAPYYDGGHRTVFLIWRVRREEHTNPTK